jgi:hypothetical protein
MKRVISDKIIISTLPHFISSYFAFTISYIYFIIIFLSSSLSILWHLQKEPKFNLLFFLDYGFALLWLIYDLGLFYLYIQYDYIIGIIIIILNKISALTNIIQFKNISYEITHSVWHLISCIKGIIITYTISNNMYFDDLYSEQCINHYYY